MRVVIAEDSVLLRVGIAKLLAEGDISLDQLERRIVLGLEVGHLSDVSRRLPDELRRERRLVRKNPLDHRVFPIVSPRKTHGHGGFARGRMNGVGDIRVALGIERVVLEHVPHCSGLLGLKLCQDRLVGHVRITTGWALKVVELDDEHAGTFGGNRKRHTGRRLHVAIEFRLLRLGGSRCRDRRRCFRRPGSLAREERDRRRRAAQKQHGHDNRGGAGQESSKIACRAAG